MVPGSTQCSSNWSADVLGHRHVGYGLGSVRALACVAGTCTGVCVPGGGPLLRQRACRRATRAASGPQPRRAPTRRAVSGACTRGARRAPRSAPGTGVQTCGSNGQWGTAAARTNSACLVGRMHRASARPGAVQCQGNVVQTCSAMARGAAARRARTRRAWPARRTGVCVPRLGAVLGQRRRDLQRERAVGNGGPCARARRVRRTRAACSGLVYAGQRGSASGNAPPQTCSTSGTWSAPWLACTNQACINGVCSGSPPTSTQCSGQQPQTCSAS